MAVDNIDPYTNPLKTLVAKLKPKVVLEVGIGEEGYSTAVWLNSGAMVTSIDKNDIKGAGIRLQQEYKVTFAFIREDSKTALPQMDEHFDLIFIDGDHRYEGCRSDIANAQRLLTKQGVIVVDDYGVESGVVDVDTGGNLIYGDYGVKQAADELFVGKWKRMYTDIPFANGARAYARK
jgi:predicted O-methyltransferase YrrM